MNYWCCTADYGQHDERCTRINRLVTERLMTKRAATIVVDAAMFGIGCLEGEMRAKIELEKGKQ